MSQAFGFNLLDKISSPEEELEGIPQHAAMSPNGKYLAVAHATSPRVSVYKRSGNTFTKLDTTDTAVLDTVPTGNATGIAWHPDSTYLVVTHATTPFMSIYTVDSDDDTFVKLANPATLPTGQGNAAAFSPDGAYLAVVHATSPFISVYSISGSTFTFVSTPSAGDRPASTGNGVAWSADSTFCAVAHTTTPYVTIYSVASSTFTKLSNPATLPTGNGQDCTFSPNMKFLAVSHTTTPYVTVYERSGSTFTKVTNPSTLPTGNATGCSFSYDGKVLTVSHVALPRVTSYRISGTTFTKMDDPSNLPTGDPNSVTYSPDGELAVVTSPANPFIYLYEFAKISTDIVNMALNHLGHDENLTDIVTDDGTVADDCRTWYIPSLLETLRKCPWPFATVINTLEHVEDDPNDDWNYSYVYPDGCVRFWRITDSDRNPGSKDAPKFKVMKGSNQTLIMADNEDASGEFTVRAVNSELYPTDFVKAFSYVLAANLAMKITGKVEIKNEMMVLAKLSIDDAFSSSLNEAVNDLLPDGEYISGR